MIYVSLYIIYSKFLQDITYTVYAVVSKRLLQTIIIHTLVCYGYNPDRGLNRNYIRRNAEGIREFRYWKTSSSPGKRGEVVSNTHEG